MLTSKTRNLVLFILKKKTLKLNIGNAVCNDLVRFNNTGSKIPKSFFNWQVLGRMDNRALHRAMWAHRMFHYTTWASWNSEIFRTEFKVHLTRKSYEIWPSSVVQPSK